MTGEDPQAALAVEGLEVSYGPIKVLHRVSLSVGLGEAVAVIGSNGAGKTTMLSGIMGLIPACAAGLNLFGKPIVGVAAHKMARAGIGYVPEGRQLFLGMSVEEELMIGGRWLGSSERRDKLAEVFDLFPRLKERRQQITRTMSGGEQQMLAIARALMLKPRLLLLDEPSLGLAPVIQDAVYRTLETLRRAGLSILLVEQNAYRALKLCDRAYVIELGQITHEGASSLLLGNPAIQSAYLGA